jgi:CheY-like chemotaxis protein
MERASSTSEPYQLVILNRRLPDMDGFDAVRTILCDYSDTGIVMMLTTENQSKDIARCGELGVCNYIVKPVRKSRLSEVTAEALNRPVDPESAEVSKTHLQEDQRPLNILLVEDYKNNRLVIQAYLSKTPYRIDVAENGAVAVQKSRSGRTYDLVLMDLQMPVMDGYTATRTIREREAALNLPPTPIIALTANGSSEDVYKCLDAGFNAHLAKPIEHNALLETIKIYTRGVIV